MHGPGQGGEKKLSAAARSHGFTQGLSHVQSVVAASAGFLDGVALVPPAPVCAWAHACVPVWCRASLVQCGAWVGFVLSLTWWGGSSWRAPAPSLLHVSRLCESCPPVSLTLALRRCARLLCALPCKRACGVCVCVCACACVCVWSATAGQVPSTRSAHAVAWVNSLGLGPRIEGGSRGLCAAFRTGALLCALLERVVKPKPTFGTVVSRPLARKQALANIEQVHRQ
jgi:hypothetical protein